MCYYATEYALYIKNTLVFSLEARVPCDFVWTVHFDKTEVFLEIP